MLRIGLTGELGTGKSTVARLLAGHGATILSSDEMARTMMQPGHAVYQAIVARFGPSIVFPDGQLNRQALATLAFDPAHPRVDELNAIIHPAVISEQEHQLTQLAQTEPTAIAIIESALLFTTRHAGGEHPEQPWRKRFDYTVLVTAPDSIKIQRFVERAAKGKALTEGERSTLEADAKARLSQQRIPSTIHPDFTLENNATLAHLTEQVNLLWRQLSQLQINPATDNR